MYDVFVISYPMHMISMIQFHISSNHDMIAYIEYGYDNILSYDMISYVIYACMYDIIQSKKLYNTRSSILTSTLLQIHQQ